MKKRLFYLLTAQKGTTLAELMAASALMCLVLGIAAGCIYPAARSARSTAEAQTSGAILDTVLSRVCRELEDSCGTIKLYPEDSRIAGEEGCSQQGSTAEFLNGNGEVVLLSALGCSETTLPNGDIFHAQEAGTLLRRTYQPGKGGIYAYLEDGQCIAHTCEAVYADAFYMGLYLEVKFSAAPAANGAEDLSAVAVTATLYRDKAKTQQVNTGCLVAELRHEPEWIFGITAQ